MASILHMVNQSPFSHQALSQCLRVFRKDDGILLYGNGVYASLKSQPCADKLQNKPCFVIKEDLSWRGIAHHQLITTCEPIDYSRFVCLTLEYDLTQSWY